MNLACCVWRFYITKLLKKVSVGFSLGSYLESWKDSRTCPFDSRYDGRTVGESQRRRVLQETSFPGNADARKRVKDAEYAFVSRVLEGFENLSSRLEIRRENGWGERRGWRTLARRHLGRITEPSTRPGFGYGLRRCPVN
ncbi:hypothetical protein NDU88_000749 [Pleurodeles waltl]|uniref:Uncharacterized protein n=1 Tax=Pleurodeles waltl TaxID=8319 RepID=A0AAV7U799_PLEWA|nr:hypothetical protein NDU88_000749 [Pleurodeles waltl]